MDWTAFVSPLLLGAAVGIIIAAVAAWVVLRRRAKEQRAAQRQQPLLQATAEAVPQQGEWTHLRLNLKNRSGAGIDVISATLLQPAGMALLNRADASEGDGHGGTKLRNPLPGTQARVTVHPISDAGRTGPAGGKSGSSDLATFSLYVHCPPAALAETTDAQLRLVLRWRDGAGQPFFVDVPVRQRALA